MIKFKSVFIHHISLLKIKSKTTFLYFQAAGSWSPYIQRKVGNSEPPEVIFFRKEMSAFGSDHYILRLLGVKFCDIGFLHPARPKLEIRSLRRLFVSGINMSIGTYNL